MSSTHFSATEQHNSEGFLKHGLGGFHGMGSLENFSNGDMEYMLTWVEELEVAAAILIVFLVKKSHNVDVFCKYSFIAVSTDIMS